MRVLFLIARQCNLLLQTKELKNRGHDNKTCLLYTSSFFQCAISSSEVNTVPALGSLYSPTLPVFHLSLIHIYIGIFHAQCPHGIALRKHP